MKKDRILYFDYVKGLLIVLVVLGHAMPENQMFHVWLYSWHMPAFFIVSGMLLNYSGYVNKSFLGKEGIFLNGILKLIVPYFAYGGCLLICRWFESGLDCFTLRWQIIDLVTFCGIGATWFLPCIFGGQIIYYIISHILFLYTKKESSLIRLVFAMMLIVIAMFAPRINFITLVLWRCFVAAGFIIIGDLLFKFILHLRKCPSRTIFNGTIILCVSAVLVFHMTGMNNASLNTLKFGNEIVYFFNAILGSFVVLYVVALSEKTKLLKLFSVFEYYGKHSLIILGTHQIIMLLFRVPIKNNYISNISFCSLIMLCEIPVIYLINKGKFIFRKGTLDGE